MQPWKHIQLQSLQFLNSLEEFSCGGRLLLIKNHVSGLFYSKVRKVDTKQIEVGKIYVISLSHRVDRRSAIADQLCYLKIPWEFFEGHTGTTALLGKNSTFSEKSLKYLTEGSLGCAQSHISLLKLITELDSDEYQIILEDDVILSEIFQKRVHEILLKYPKHCDLFYLGSRNKRSRDILHKTSLGYSRGINNRLGAYGYMVNSSGAKDILDAILPIDLRFGGIDTAYAKAAREGKITTYQLDRCAVKHNNEGLSNIYNPLSRRKKIHPMTVTKWPRY